MIDPKIVYSGPVVSAVSRTAQGIPTGGSDLLFRGRILNPTVQRILQSGQIPNWRSGWRVGLGDGGCKGSGDDIEIPFILSKNETNRDFRAKLLSMSSRRHIRETGVSKDISEGLSENVALPGQGEAVNNISRTPRNVSPNPNSPPTPTSSGGTTLPAQVYSKPSSSETVDPPQPSSHRTTSPHSHAQRHPNLRGGERRNASRTYYPESSRPENFKQTTRTLAYFVGQSHIYKGLRTTGSSDGPSTSTLGSTFSSPPSSLSPLSISSSVPVFGSGSLGSPSSATMNTGTSIQSSDEMRERFPPMPGAGGDDMKYEHSVISANSTLLDPGTPSTSKSKSIKSISSSLLTLDDDDADNDTKEDPFVEEEDEGSSFDLNDPNSLLSDSFWRKHLSARGIDPDRMEVESFMDDAESIKFSHPFDMSRDTLSLEFGEGDELKKR